MLRGGGGWIEEAAALKNIGSVAEMFRLIKKKKKYKVSSDRVEVQKWL